MQNQLLFDIRMKTAPVCELSDYLACVTQAQSLLVAICNQLVSGGGCVVFPCSLVETFVRKQETLTVFNRLFTISNSRLNMPGTEVEEVLCFYAKFFFHIYSLVVVALWLVRSTPDSNPGRGHCVVFLGKTQMGTDEFNAGGNPAMD